MGSVALIACSNGYGHTRRLLLIAEALEKCGVKSTLFAPASIANYLSGILEINTPRVINFDTETTIYDWVKGNSGNWVKRIPDLCEYDEVISDNLADVLKLRDDSWLSGSFLWHESLPNIPQRVTNDQTKLLAKFKQLRPPGASLAGGRSKSKRKSRKRRSAKKNEEEMSSFNFLYAPEKYLYESFLHFEKSSQILIGKNLAIPAYEQCIKASHSFNLLDSRGLISVSERQAYILRIRSLVQKCCELLSNANE